ncbi:MAG: AbrB/MazE/SpoVT family DNA-binding domain-containing protein [Candidatus Diapherotrites archaeon]|nr:AbrB/MazE/SpoVT family DNA-binding domain-containing protein [Candidatus Diapherotrites archaeon]
MLRIKRKVWRTGHVTIPHEIRKAIGLKPGDRIEMTTAKNRNDGITIKKVKGKT